MTTPNKLIQTSDYNSIRTTVSNIVGVGSASKGYGQPINSRNLSNHELVSQFDWDLLRFDILNARIHQVGSATLTEINQNELISSSTAAPYQTISSTLDSTAERFKLATGQFQTDLEIFNTSREWGSGTTPSTWYSEINAIVRVSFNTANDARYFFNSGGEVRITSSRTNPPSGRSHEFDQSTSWTTLLTSAGRQAFGGLYSSISTVEETRAVQNGLNFYNLTNTFVAFYSKKLSGTYDRNRYVLEARSEVSNNTTGTATWIEIKIRFIDEYTDPPSGEGVLGFPREVGPEDLVDGLFSIKIDQIKASSADFNPITSVLTSSSNEFSRNTVIVPTASVPYIKTGMRVTSAGGEVGTNQTIQSLSIVGSDTICFLNSNTDSIVPLATPVTFQNTFSISTPSYSLTQALGGT